MKKEYKHLYEKFGLNIVYYRKRKKLTQLQLAELVDIDRSHISAIELGNVGVSFDVIFKMCDYLILGIENNFIEPINHKNRLNTVDFYCRMDIHI